VKLKIDENLPFEACRILRDAGHDSVSVLDQGLGGRPDPDIASICKSEGRTLVTLDTDFSNILAYPPEEFSGIIVIRTDNQAKPIVLELVRRISSAVNLESPQGTLWIVEKNRIRVRGPE
jgi:predicted nuclease of predicted toxin-antitoxin system